MRLVPMRKASKPASRSLSSSALLPMPDSLTAMQSSGILSMSFERSLRADVERFEIAIVDADDFLRRHEEHGRVQPPYELRRAVPSSVHGRGPGVSASCASASAATMSRKLSASFARVSQTCHGSKMKSLRRTGICMDLRAVAEIFQRVRGKILLP